MSSYEPKKKKKKKRVFSFFVAALVIEGQWYADTEKGGMQEASHDVSGFCMLWVRKKTDLLTG